MANTTSPNAPDFEFFQGNLSESRTLPQVTVRKGGLMVLTRAAVDLLGDDVTHVQLAYNRKSGAIGIRASAEDAPGCYHLRTQPKSPSRLVGGKRFFRHHQLPCTEAQTFSIEDFGNGIIGFQLPEQSELAEAAPAEEPKKPARSRKSRTA